MGWWNLTFGNWLGTQGVDTTNLPLNVNDSLLFNPGGVSDGQNAVSADGILSGTTGFTFGMWVKEGAGGDSGVVACVHGDEDRSPLTIANGGAQANTGGSEDGSRLFFYRRISGGENISVNEKTNFNETPAAEAFTDTIVNPNQTDWNLVVYTISPTEAKLYMNSAANPGFAHVITHTYASITSLADSLGPLVIGSFRRGPAPLIFGTPTYLLYKEMNVHSAFLYDGILTESDIQLMWSPIGSTAAADINPVDPLTATTENGTLTASWVFAGDGQTYTNGSTILDRTENGNDLTLTSTAVAWSEVNNKDTGDAP